MTLAPSKRPFIKITLMLVLLNLAGCASKTSRYFQTNDSAPVRLPQDIVLDDAKPKHENYATATLRPYKVLGRNYKPMQNAKGYSQQGQASWYGQKFHGHRTANGEVYDMYRMSAAHKTLPLPSFVRVTNLSNGKQVVVRVNDRGPFHSERIIDLSYAAALKLDYLKSGIANVKLDVVHVDPYGNITVGNGPTISADEYFNIGIAQMQNTARSLFIQVAALQDGDKIAQLASGLAMLYQIPTQTPIEQGIYRLRLGPLASEQQAGELLNELKQNGYSQAYKLYLPN
jgi:rare lipoprotein A